MQLKKIYMPEKMASTIQRLADKDEVSFSSVVRLLILKGLKNGRA